MGAEMTVRVDGATPVSGTVTSNAGTGPSVANAWNMKVTDGTDTAQVSTSGLGAALLVSTGTQTAGRTLAGVAGNTTGTTVDTGSGHSDFTGVLQVSGTLTGTATLELSLDGSSWVSSTVTFTITTAGNFPLYSIGRPARYGRITLSGAGGTGTLSADIMAA